MTTEDSHGSEAMNTREGGTRLSNLAHMMTDQGAVKAFHGVTDLTRYVAGLPEGEPPVWVDPKGTPESDWSPEAIRDMAYASRNDGRCQHPSDEDYDRLIEEYTRGKLEQAAWQLAVCSVLAFTLSVTFLLLYPDAYAAGWCWSITVRVACIASAVLGGFSGGLSARAFWGLLRRPRA